MEFVRFARFCVTNTFSSREVSYVFKDLVRSPTETIVPFLGILFGPVGNEYCLASTEIGSDKFIHKRTLIRSSPYEEKEEILKTEVISVPKTVKFSRDFGRTMLYLSDNDRYDLKFEYVNAYFVYGIKVEKRLADDSLFPKPPNVRIFSSFPKFSYGSTSYTPTLKDPAFTTVGFKSQPLISESEKHPVILLSDMSSDVINQIRNTTYDKITAPEPMPADITSHDISEAGLTQADPIPKFGIQYSVVSPYKLNELQCKKYIKYATEHFHSLGLDVGEEDCKLLIYILAVNFSTSVGCVQNKNQIIYVKNDEKSFKIDKSDYLNYINGKMKLYNSERKFCRAKSDDIINLLRKEIIKVPDNIAVKKGFLGDYTYLACDFLVLNPKKLSSEEVAALGVSERYLQEKNKMKRSIVNAVQIL